MNCIICTSGVSTFAQVMNTPFSLMTFFLFMAALVAVALYACYRIGIAYTKQAHSEIDYACGLRREMEKAKAGEVAWSGRIR